MGQANCACVKTVSFDHNQIESDKRLRVSRKENQIEDEEIKLLKSIIKIQALLRGWIVRKKYHYVQVQLYNTKVNNILKQFSLTHLSKFSKMPPFPFSEYRYQDTESDSYDNRFFRNAVLLENGAIYIGEWSGDKKFGKGIQIWKDGSIYEGFWIRDMANGKGRLYHANGDIYDGDWEDHKSKGQGVYIHSDGARYEGSWNNDLQNGQGVEIWPDGAKHEGEYSNGVKHGKGRFVWADKASYCGQFLNNQINGVGRYVWPDGRKYCGEWLNNKMHGTGLFSWSDGRVYIGEYQDDKKHGQGVFEWYSCYLNCRPDGRKYVGYWLEGKQHGRGLFIAGAQRKQGEWKGGNRERWIIFESDTDLDSIEKKMNQLKIYYSSIDDSQLLDKSKKPLPLPNSSLTKGEKFKPLQNHNF
ncbi:unnamed protein product (macronuclear) [Paramecium tetraurelia]|uniref:MORN repeat protein n=1 Tax=Paramecium tetraurelia TaxID=5888 RepID=A0C7P3_PARTE|nr:uncharacterized protein GSPATT00035940001 [Paramecium tetraurelia]CAK66810.1 unnamed protein product [Paramecium tetraurelia]|eukprot:XP_001434207.1 hypothetical protein (macronuclear) [Paramecium tetraurelia strain d4-2]